MYDEFNKKGWDAYKEAYKDLPDEFKEYTQMDLVNHVYRLRSCLKKWEDEAKILQKYSKSLEQQD